MSTNKSKLTKSIQDRGNFTPVPNDIWEAPIPTQSKLIFIYLLSNSEKWAPGHREIHSNTGVRRASISNYIKELEDKNMLTVTPPPKQGMRAKYEFTSLLSWNLENKQTEDINMEKSEKIIKAYMVQFGDEDLRKDVMTEVVQLLHSNGISEEESEFAIKKLKREIEATINSTKMDNKGKENWILRLNKALDGAFALCYSDDINLNLDIIDKEVKEASIIDDSEEFETNDEDWD